jgi:hypothetical protein
MDIRVLNTNFVAVDILDGIDSILWIERYSSFGEFEIFVKYSDYYLNLLNEDYYLINTDSDRIMIIESINIITDPENGDKLIVKGRSFESVIDRRIVLRQIVLDTTLQTGIQTIITSEIIDGIFPERNFPSFVFAASSDPLVTTPTLKGAYYFENVYDVISNLCLENNIGFRILRNASNQFEFSLYAGANRSYSQSANRYVVFSPTFDNLIKSDYFRTKMYKKNYIFVIGDTGAADWNDNSYGRWAQAWTNDVGSGFSRREMFLDLSHLQKNYDGGTVPISDDDYVAMLQQRGYEELAKNPEHTIFEGEVDLSRTYTYRTDFFLGDIIQMVDRHGHSSSVRITEITMYQDKNGFSIHPTLKTV